jgi:MFS family permease
MSQAEHKSRTLALTGMLHCFTHLYGNALLPLYLLMQRDLKLDSVSKATSFVTIMLVAYYLPSYALGVLADRMSRKKLLAYGLLINALAFVGLAFSPSYGCGIACVIVAGIGGSAYHPAATAMIARLFPRETGRALGLAGIGSGVGFFLGPLYTGWRAAMLESTLGAAAWRRPVLEIGIMGLVAAVLFAWLATEEAVVEDDMSAPSIKLFPTTSLWILFFLACLLIGFRDFAGGVMGSLSSLFLQNARGYNTGRAGLAVSMLFVGGIIGNPLLGALSEGRRKLWIFITLGVGSVFIVLLPHLPSGWTLPCLLAYGFFFLASFPIIEAALMQSVPDAVRGRVFGFYVMITGLMSAVAPWMVGLWMRQMGQGASNGQNYFGVYAINGIIGLLALTGLPCLLAIRKREHLDEAPGSEFQAPTSEFK